MDDNENEHSVIRLTDRYEIVYAPSATSLKLVLERGRTNVPVIPGERLPQELPRRHDSARQETSKQIPMLHENEGGFWPRYFDSIPLQREISKKSHFLAVPNPDGTLQFANIEVLNIATHFEKPHILQPQDATNDTLYKQAQQVDILHFSCHGQFQFSEPLKSCLKLKIKEQAFFTRQEYKDFLVEFPHAAEVISSLMSKHSDEGIFLEWKKISTEQRELLGKDCFQAIMNFAQERLTLQDIFANLKLPKAAVVVLSACETGMIKLESADEYIGLPSGFLYAGASAVISSLWAVDDVSTSILMNQWYKNVIQKKMRQADALRKAQDYVKNLTVYEIRSVLESFIETARLRIARDDSERDRLEEQINELETVKGNYENFPDNELPFSHPHYWGAFVCTGNWE